MDEPSEGNAVETLDIGLCREAHQMGCLIGKRFSGLIKSRVATDLTLQKQLLPFARTPRAKSLLEALETSNRERYPRYWDELLGTAVGSGVPFLHIMLLNFRKEILPFIPNERIKEKEEAVDDDCSDVLVVDESMAFAAHNEDANVALLGHTFLVRAELPNGLSFTAYTYAGELPSCAFGFNSNGLAFTLNSVPPSNDEIAAGGVGRNFVSRDLLEATGLADAVNRIRSPNVSVGHCYNLVDVRNRRILNVETTSQNRFSVREVGATPFFHANMYLHLQVKQLQDENSICRQRRAALLSVESKEEALQILGDAADEKFPIFMTGPTLHTLCTVLIDLDEQTMTIFKGNPKKREISHVFRID
ncbi:uncharacterized protein LOC109716053 isoform X1 [Ananas comosus]|uniref:Uncharacterized protein LOC109716053 isoform X1 n=2 Tax=Ananas comosus TaxID=4615 RepID=A0A199V1W1_ANACO|nr:uncharacterized protein LOC109716053 isoform X1 [Ananas comosus]OAY70973.1 hypothetical protein ACMD2_04848 [Ananas comosus]CAD1843318.1 unnamed protein product [Ananas comosus var. bracteatus]